MITLITQYNFSIKLSRYVITRKDLGSNPDEVIDFFNLPNSSSRTMALEFTQPLT
jgi:hypothetical protein